MVDTHQSLIETYYGPGRLLSAVTILQKECDMQTKRIVQEFARVRQIDKKINQILDLSRMSSSASFSKERIDPKDLDIVIGEITVMHSRTELYIRFIKRKVTSDAEVGVATQEGKNKILSDLDKMINNSELSQSKHTLLSHYLQLEQYFMEESVSKAVSMDTLEDGQQTSSMVDDTFFVIKKCIRYVFVLLFILKGKT